MEQKFTYMPILKGKEGEFKALEECPTALKSKMSPMIELVDYKPSPISPEKLAKRKKPVRTYADYLSDNLGHISGFWDTGTAIFVDTHLIPEAVLCPTRRTSYIPTIHDTLRHSGITAVPVIHTNYNERISSWYKAVIENNGEGMCLRLSADDLDDDNLDGLINEALSKYGLEPELVDLVLDYSVMTSGIVNNMARAIAQTVNNSIPHLDKWRSFTVASGAFPVDLSDMKPDSMNQVEKSDWKLWNAIRSKKLKRFPAFGDYAIAHPVYREIDPRKITMSAGFRYTGEDDWFVAKGRSIKTHKFIQMHALAAKVVALPEYGGAHFSQGDDWLQRCSVRTTTTGSATTWRQAGSNRHFHKVISQLSTLGVL